LTLEIPRFRPAHFEPAAAFQILGRPAFNTAMSKQLSLSSDSVTIAFQPDCGFVASMVVHDGSQEVSMLHAAPWAGDGSALPAGSPPHHRDLAGDFFCAPFGGAASMDHAPLHGWPANSLWEQIEITHHQGAARLRATLSRPACGAILHKELTLRDSHPFLYQRHVFAGGDGLFPVANHAMLSLPKGGRLAFSPKRWFETLADALENDPARGRSLLAYPARSADARVFPLAGGGHADLTVYPLGDRHEDFVTAIDMPGVDESAASLGWTLVQRPVEGDLYISLRNASRLPLTMMWHSNGGRDYAPWNGRHSGVLGIEEGVGRAVLGLSGQEPGVLFGGDGTPEGVRLEPGCETAVSHVTGCIAWPAEAWPATVEALPGELLISAQNGYSRSLPFDSDFLGGA
jgi:hypothetical protein